MYWVTYALKLQYNGLPKGVQDMYHFKVSNFGRAEEYCSFIYRGFDYKGEDDIDARVSVSFSYKPAYMYQ